VSFLRLLHISDTHFCEVPNRRNIMKLSQDPPALSLTRQGKKISTSVFPGSFDVDVAAGLASFVTDVGSELDLIIHSGDLATTGRPSDLDVAFVFVDGQPSGVADRSHRPHIQGHASKIFPCPGNHDKYKDNFGNPFSPNFELKFKRYWRPQRYDIMYRYLPSEEKRVCLVAIDFCLRSASDAEFPAAKNKYGRGKAYPDILDRLNYLMIELKSYSETTKFIWVVHFPPFDDCKSYELLLGYEEVSRLASKHGISLIVSGHLHRNSVSKTQFGTPILCAGSACSVDETPNCWIHLLDIEEKEDGSFYFQRTDFRWNNNDGTFDPLGPQLILQEIA
jgi:predicted phosphodiesterase